MKILITGGAGNIGASLARRLVKNPAYTVVVVDNLLTGSSFKMPNEYDNFQFVKADVNNYNDIAPLMASFNFDYVFHYAAVVGVKRTLKNPMAVLKDIEGIKNILTLSKNTGVKRVFYSSSSEVYGEPVEIPQVENTTPLNSRLPYAVVKNVGESFFRTYHKEFGLSYTIFRLFNTYGPLQSEDFVISKFVETARKNEPLTIYGKGLQTRTFCYIDDNLDFTVKCLYEDLFVNDVINVGSDEEITIKDLASRVIKITGSSSKMKYLPPLKDGDMLRRLPDVSRMKKTLGRELVSIDQGIERTFKAIAGDFDYIKNGKS